MYRISIHLQPRAARTRIVGRHGSAIKAQVHAAPVDGAANDALLRLMSEVLAVPRAAVRLVQGHTSRRKIVEIDADPETCESRLSALLAATRVDKAKSCD